MRYFTIDIAYRRDEDEQPTHYKTTYITYNGKWRKVEKEEKINKLNSTKEEMITIYTRKK